jgi:hypothetical protein
MPNRVNVRRSAKRRPATRSAQEQENLLADARLASAGLTGATMESAAPDAMGAVNRLVMSGGQDLARALVSRMQGTLGNSYVQRILLGPDSTQPSVAPHVRVHRLADEQESQSKAGDGGGIVTVTDDFEPEEFDDVPDEGIKLAVVGSGEPAGTAAKKSAAPPVAFVDGGRVGTAQVGDHGVSNEDDRPRAFTASGRTGTVVWAGGGGAGPHGNEAAGSIQTEVAPDYQSRSNGMRVNSDAWVRAGTGSVDVVRSFVGANAGDQGNGWYLTTGAANRFDQHEQLHVASSQGHYNTNVVPLLARVANSAVTGKAIAFTRLGAISDLKAQIKWADSLKAFQRADRADNKPMGSVDTNDLASGTYPIDAGPGTVGGKAYQHRARLASEPNPA